MVRCNSLDSLIIVSLSPVLLWVLLLADSEHARAAPGAIARAVVERDRRAVVGEGDAARDSIRARRVVGEQVHLARRLAALRVVDAQLPAVYQESHPPPVLA